MNYFTPSKYIAMSISTPTNKSLDDQFSYLSLQAETFSLAYHTDTGWSQPFPDVDSEMTLVFAFADTDFFHNPSALHKLKEAYPQSTLVGCGATETFNNGERLVDAISVGIIKFQSTEIKFAVVDLPDSTTSKSAGRELAERLMHPKLKGVLLFSNGLKVEATELVRGIQETLPQGIPIAGGLASDLELMNCWINANGELRDDAVCAVGLVGDKVEMVCASGGGWRPVSDRHVANKANNKKIYEIDGRPAYDVFAEQLASKTIDESPWAMTLANQTIALKLDGVDLVRSFFSSDQKEGWLEFAGDVPEGIEIQFMESTVDEILDGVAEAAHGIHMKTVGLSDNSLCVVIGCAARSAILGDQVSEEASRLRSSVGENIPQIGMYSLGEILTTTCGHPQVHNLTMAAAVIREH